MFDFYLITDLSLMMKFYTIYLLVSTALPEGDLLPWTILCLKQFLL
jgi:hypothetical protein